MKVATKPSNKSSIWKIISWLIPMETGHSSATTTSAENRSSPFHTSKTTLKAFIWKWSPSLVASARATSVATPPSNTISTQSMANCYPAMASYQNKPRSNYRSFKIYNKNITRVKIYPRLLRRKVYLSNSFKISKSRTCSRHLWLSSSRRCLPLFPSSPR